MLGGYVPPMSTSQINPPPQPWQKGSHGSHSVLGIEVQVCRDAEGRVFSCHQLQGADDLTVAMSWPGGGQEEVGFALLAEAVRREALLEMLLLVSKDASFPQRFEGMSFEEKETQIAELSARLRVQMSSVVARLARGAIEEAIYNVSH